MHNLLISTSRRSGNAVRRRQRHQSAPVPKDNGVSTILPPTHRSKMTANVLIGLGLVISGLLMLDITFESAEAMPFGGGSRMPQPPPNYEGKHFYKVLDVTADAKPAEIRRQFRRLAKRHHPDMQNKNGKTLTEAQTKANSEKFKTITEAYQVLSDKDKRKEYDLHRRDPAGSARRWGPPPSGGGGGYPFPPGGGGEGFPPDFEDFMNSNGNPNSNRRKNKPTTGAAAGNNKPTKKKASAPTSSNDDFQYQDQSGGDEMPDSFDEFLRREFGESFFSGGSGDDENDDMYAPTEEDLERYARDGGEGSERNLFRDANRRKRERETKQRTRVRESLKESLKRMGAGPNAPSTAGDNDDTIEKEEIPGIRVPEGVDHDMLFSLRGHSGNEGPSAPRRGPPSPASSSTTVPKSKRPSTNKKDINEHGSDSGSSWFGSLFGKDGGGGKKKGSGGRGGSHPAPTDESEDPFLYYAATDDEILHSQRAQDRLKWAQEFTARQQHRGGDMNVDGDDVEAGDMTDEEVDKIMAESAIREAKEDAEINANIYTTAEEKAVLRGIKATERDRKMRRLRNVIMAKQNEMAEKESAEFRKQQSIRAAKSIEERKKQRQEAFDRQRLFGSAPPGPDDLFEEIMQEDMYGQQRLVRRKRKLRPVPNTRSIHTSDGDEPFSDDPLENAYAENPHRLNGDGYTGTTFGSNAAPEPEMEDRRNFIVPDAEEEGKESSSSTAVGTGSMAEEDDDRGDPDPLDHLFGSSDSIPKPRSKKEKEMMEWAYKMAKRMGNTMPKGPSANINPKMSAKEAAAEMMKSGVDPVTGEKLKPGQRPSMPKDDDTKRKDGSRKNARGGGSSTKKPESKPHKKKTKPSASSSTTTNEPPHEKKKSSTEATRHQRGNNPQRSSASGGGGGAGLNFADIPDMGTKPTPEQMEAMGKLFDPPRSPDDVIASDRPHTPEEYNRIFKNGRPPTEEELKDAGVDVPTTAPSTTSPKKKRPTKTKTATPENKKPSPPVAPPTDEQPEDTHLTAETFETYCGGGGSDVDVVSTIANKKKKKACVIMFSSATSRSALARTLDSTVKRYPVSTKTFYVMRSEVEGISAFLFERVRVAHRTAGLPEPPTELKEAMCRTYRFSTTANAGEICAIVIRDGGLAMQVVGRQRLDNFDVPPQLKSQLNGVVDGAILPPTTTGGSGRVGAAGTKKGAGGVHPNTIVRGKDAEALIYLPIKRQTFQWIERFD